MKLLITTSFSLLVLDTQSNHTRRIHQGDGLYYGLTRNDQSIYVAVRKRMVSSNVPAEDERGEILIFDLNLNLQGRLVAPFPLRDLHQIAWYAGKLWATCSYDNMVAIWDGTVWQRWFPLAETVDSPRDVHHYNSFFFEDDLVWLLAHNHGPSELLAFSLPSLKLVDRIEIGIQAHNIWREGDQLFTCSSGDGRILGNSGFLIETGKFPRGYLFDEDKRYVGISERTERKHRDFTTGVVRIFDKSWIPLQTINLPNEGLVLDILTLN